MRCITVDSAIRRHIDEYVHVARQHALDDMHAQFGALADDLTDPLAHRALQHLVTILGRPNHVIAMVKCACCRIAVSRFTLRAASKSGRPLIRSLKRTGWKPVASIHSMDSESSLVRDVSTPIQEKCPVLRNLGLKMGRVAKGRFEDRVRELVDGNAMLEAAANPILTARRALRTELADLEKLSRDRAKSDPVCRQFMTMPDLRPSVGAIVALTVKSAIEDPDRFRSSKYVGPWVYGLHPPHAPLPQGRRPHPRGPLLGTRPAQVEGRVRP